MKIIPFVLASLFILTAGKAHEAIDTATSVMNYSFTVHHISVTSRKDFTATIRDFESRLGVFAPESIKSLATENPNVESVTSKVEAMAGSSGFMRFGAVRMMGDLLPLVGKPIAHAHQYVIGNPLFAVQMTQHNSRAGLYAPLRILIFEDDSKLTYLEYDLPSSLFGQFKDERITKIAMMLDKKVEDLTKAAAGR